MSAQINQLTITLDRSARAIVITLVGALDMVVEEDVDEFVSKALANPVGLSALHVDTTGITFIGSSGLRTLLSARRAALDKGLTFTLGLADSGPVQRMVDLFGLRTWLVDGRLEEAV